MEQTAEQRRAIESMRYTLGMIERERKRAYAAGEGADGMKLSEPLIGLGGLLRSGKDTVADRLVEQYDYIKVGFSDALLEHAKRLDPYIKVTLGEANAINVNAGARLLPGYHRFNNLLADLGYVEAKTVADFREFMQKDGTEGGRNFFGENVWVNIMAEAIDNHRSAGHPVVVTGVRYPNELSMIQELSGVAVWVDRPGIESGSSHTSENSVRMEMFDWSIDNAYELDHLYDEVDVLASAVKMI